MGYAQYSRFVRCRAANISPWARQMNFALDGSRRGLVAGQRIRFLCSETMPATSFAEQRISGPAGGVLATSGLSICESASECDSVAAIIDGLSGPGAIVLSELMGLATRWVSYPKFLTGKAAA
eukprot:TRINITY_DN102856_c0_g1_i1.p1 TRINITY_DN102856_c0_g1~~TRINITY_DN102856_c0_g1_i1.p1  ORF type:complete len:123 (-),score=10.70 TRINITY_DN102856_c0_g1_i1:232-600(-)